MAPFEFRQTGRKRVTAIVVGGIWVAICFAIVVFDASLVLMTILLLFTAPALYDLMSNRASGLRIDEDGVHWFSGRRTADIAWTKIDHIRLDTRLDFSVRASVVLLSGKKLRVPLEAIPHADVLTQALEERGVTVKRHHFSLVG